MEHRMMKKGGNPVFGIVHNLRLVTTTHNQQVMQRDFFEIFGWNRSWNWNTLHHGFL